MYHIHSSYHPIIQRKSMNHILFFVYAIGRKHTCIDGNLSGSWLVELECWEGSFHAVLQIFNCLIHSHQQRIPDLSCVWRKKGTTIFSASQTRSSKAAYHADDIFCFLLIDTTKGAVRVHLSGSQFSVVTRVMRGGQQFIR